MSSGLPNQLLLAVLDVRRPARRKLAFHVLRGMAEQVDSVNNVVRKVLPSNLLDEMISGDFDSYTANNLRMARLALRNVGSESYSAREFAISQCALCKQMDQLLDSPTVSPDEPAGTFLTDVHESADERCNNNKEELGVDYHETAPGRGFKTSLAIEDCQIPPLDDDFDDGDDLAMRW